MARPVRVDDIRKDDGARLQTRVETARGTPADQRYRTALQQSVRCRPGTFFSNPANLYQTLGSEHPPALHLERSDDPEHRRHRAFTWLRYRARAHSGKNIE